MIDLSGDPRVGAFAHDGGAIGCLLLHGFTGTPGEMRPIGERLAARGYSVRAPLLPGHGTRVEDLQRSTWKEWFATALSSWDELGDRAPRRVVAGLSMGALLALHLARERPGEVLAVAVLAPALELANQRSADVAGWLRWLPQLPRRFEIVPKLGGRLTPAYDEIPLRGLASMLDLQSVVRSELGEITAPALIVDGGSDQTISSRGVTAIESGLGSAIKRRRHFPRSGHIMTEDVDGPAVVDAVETFFAEMLSDPIVR